MAQTKTAPKKRTAKKTTAKAKSTGRKTAKKASASKAPTKKAAKKKAKAKTAKKKSPKEAAAEQEVTIDRRRAGRREEEPQTTPEPQQKLERRQKVNRRRQIDPTTCEREYNDAEVEFMNALDEYKRTSGRMFPTCSEVLEVIVGLGYVKLSPAELAVVRPQPETTEETAMEDSQGEEEQALADVDEANELSAEVREG